MKIVYEDILGHLVEQPCINEVSEKLFQLGHEHEIQDSIFDIEFTPNRGDCLSLQGIIRDLGIFYNVDLNLPLYEKSINELLLDFENTAQGECPSISFLRLEIDECPTNYIGVLNDYFKNFSLNKNNFFTDVSNYISYEMGQPTHCYDAKKISETLSLKKINETTHFETLLNKNIELRGENLVFCLGNEVINLAGIVGGKSTSCSKDTKDVIIECAYFLPEEIIGKSVKYDIHSDASYKFERNVDPLCHEKILRRFIKIVEENTNINKIEIFSENYKNFNQTAIPSNVLIINKILGINLLESDYHEILTKLGFIYENEVITIPSYRNDIASNNDIAEEIARSIGYNNISNTELKIIKSSSNECNYEYKMKSFMVNKGFFEVINNPFNSENEQKSIRVDNPLDSNREFLRVSLKQSLINNLLFNERRQKDSIKLFEISDAYSYLDKIENKRLLGIIASGRVGKNYKDFSKTVDQTFLYKTFEEMIPHELLRFEEIPRKDLDTKLNHKIYFLEIELSQLPKLIENREVSYKSLDNFKKYEPISEFPSSNRDLSFSISDFSKLNLLENLMYSYDHELIKEVFLFDYYKNEKTNEIKIGFRYIFQSNDMTMTDQSIDLIMSDIIELATNIKSVKLPGIKT